MDSRRCMRMVERNIRASLVSAMSLDFSSVFQTPTFGKCIFFNVHSQEKWL